jgi:hypothetical protein
VDEIGAGLGHLGGARIDIVDHVPAWFLAGHRKEPTGGPPGRPKGAQDSYQAHTRARRQRPGRDQFLTSAPSGRPACWGGRRGTVAQAGPALQEKGLPPAVDGARAHLRYPVPFVTLRLILFLKVYSLLGAGGQHPDLTLARLA